MTEIMQVLLVLSMVGIGVIIYLSSCKHLINQDISAVLIFICIVIILIAMFAPGQTKYKMILRNNYEVIKSSDTVWVQYKKIKEEFTDAKTYNTIDKRSWVYVKEQTSAIGITMITSIVLDKTE